MSDDACSAVGQTSIDKEVASEDYETPSEGGGVDEPLISAAATATSSLAMNRGGRPTLVCPESEEQPPPSDIPKSDAFCYRPKYYSLKLDRDIKDDEKQWRSAADPMYHFDRSLAADKEQPTEGRSPSLPRGITRVAMVPQNVCLNSQPVTNGDMALSPPSLTMKTTPLKKPPVHFPTSQHNVISLSPPPVQVGEETVIIRLKTFPKLRYPIEDLSSSSDSEDKSPTTSVAAERRQPTPTSTGALFRSETRSMSPVKFPSFEVQGNSVLQSRPKFAATPQVSARLSSVTRQLPPVPPLKPPKTLKLNPIYYATSNEPYRQPAATPTADSGSPEAPPARRKSYGEQVLEQVRKCQDIAKALKSPNIAPSKAQRMFNFRKSRVARLECGENTGVQDQANDETLVSQANNENGSVEFAKRIRNPAGKVQNYQNMAEEYGGVVTNLAR
ncbi:unnamed protein product [Soboliphyme baturini]|uniref:Synaptopodin-2-like n=1 Tax=Soboliphyme baturini TaxID=241478 RepID=A0A183J8D8_9BILA|nr:unnamed protein product [Soboliphyme baturini]